MKKKRKGTPHSHPQLREVTVRSAHVSVSPASRPVLLAHSDKSKLTACRGGAAEWCSGFAYTKVVAQRKYWIPSVTFPKKVVAAAVKEVSRRVASWEEHVPWWENHRVWVSPRQVFLGDATRRLPEGSRCIGPKLFLAVSASASRHVIQTPHQ